MKIFKICIVSLLILFPLRGRGATIPGSLGTAEIKRTIEIFGLHTTSRMMRSAEAYRTWPGIKFGFEAMIVPGKEINTLGDGSGDIPKVNFVPRVHISKGLFFGLEVIVNFFPLSATNSLTTSGAILKWTMMSEEEYPFSLAPYFGLTKISGFGGYKGTNYELGALVSSDMVRTKPYMGLGLLMANGEILNGLATGSPKGKESTLHLFFGAEIELPINITFQLDFMNVAVSGSVFLGKKF